MDAAAMNMLCFVGIVLALVEIHKFCCERHDEKIAEMMRRGEGPDHYVTYDGRSIMNVRCIMKKMKEMRENGEL
jgi:hypothetical protein